MPIKVLIVEDDKNIADLLRIYLEKEQMECELAGDGLVGVEKFRQFQPDLVLLDIMLPGMDGWAVCRKIRETSKTPVIMLTRESWRTRFPVWKWERTTILPSPLR